MSCHWLLNTFENRDLRADKAALPDFCETLVMW